METDRLIKYIDAEKLIAEIRKLRSESCISESDDYYEYAKSEIIDIITSLQQEQPEVDLEEAAAAIIIKKHPIMKVASTMEMAFYEMLELVKAGYELGFNARKEV